METVTQNLIITTDFGKSGYRFLAKDLNNGSEYTSEWILRYSDFLLEKSLFALSAEIALFEKPGSLIDFDSDTILDYNYLAQIAFKISNSKLTSTQFWPSRQAQEDHKRNLSIYETYAQKIKLKTFEEEELEVLCEDKLLLIEPLNKVIVIASAKVI